MATAADARSLGTSVPPVARMPPAVRTVLARWSGAAWGAIGVTALFVGITCWWLTQDSSVPIFDAGLHISYAIDVHYELAGGHLGKALTLSIPYPPFVYLVGSLGILLGGVGVAPLILAQNLIFLPLLALGCYHVGKLAFGSTAGLLVVVFALGSPLITAQFHVFMTDAPETAMVAVSVWLIVATDGFSKLGVCALAGLAVGLGMLTKEPFAIFVLGVVCVTVARGGRGAWRGLAVFAAIALAIALPWYIHEIHHVKGFGEEATASSGTYSHYTIPGVAPSRGSLENLSWYLWSFINAQLYLPLFVFAAVGWLWVLAGSLRKRAVSPLALELLVGAFLAWLILTETFVHDIRYGMPMLVFLAVFGAGWVTRLPRRWSAVVAAVLVAIALANTLATSFGTGGLARVVLPGKKLDTLEQPGVLTLYSNRGFLVAAPKRDGDLLAMFQALRRDGIEAVGWSGQQALGAGFSQQGVFALAQIAGLEALGSASKFGERTSVDATLAHETIKAGESPPCVALDDGTGIWVRLGNPSAKGAREFCPLPKPHFYGGG